MNIENKKDIVLLEIIKIFDDTINSFFKTHKVEDEKIFQKLDITNIGFWIFLPIPIIYIICLLPCIFNDNIIFIIIIFFNTIFLFLYIFFDERIINKKILEKTRKKKANYYDLFFINIKDVDNEKLKFALEYIEYLTSDKYRMSNYVSIFSFIVGYFLNIVTDHVGTINDQNFILNLVKFLFASILTIKTINMFIEIYFLKKIKLLKLKKFIDRVLLIRNSKNI